MLTSPSTCAPALGPGVDWLSQARRARLRKWVSDEQEEADQETLLQTKVDGAEFT